MKKIIKNISYPFLGKISTKRRSEENKVDPKNLNKEERNIKILTSYKFLYDLTEREVELLRNNKLPPRMKDIKIIETKKKVTLNNSFVKKKEKSSSEIKRFNRLLIAKKLSNKNRVDSFSNIKIIKKYQEYFNNQKLMNLVNQDSNISQLKENNNLQNKKSRQILRNNSFDLLSSKSKAKNETKDTENKENNLINNFNEKSPLINKELDENNAKDEENIFTNKLFKTNVDFFKRRSSCCLPNMGSGFLHKKNDAIVLQNNHSKIENNNFNLIYRNNNKTVKESESFENINKSNNKLSNSNLLMNNSQTNFNNNFRSTTPLKNNRNNISNQIRANIKSIVPSQSNQNQNFQAESPFVDPNTKNKSINVKSRMFPIFPKENSSNKLTSDQENFNNNSSTQYTKTKLNSILLNETTNNERDKKKYIKIKHEISQNLKTHELKKEISKLLHEGRDIPNDILIEKNSKRVSNYIRSGFYCDVNSKKFTKKLIYKSCGDVKKLLEKDQGVNLRDTNLFNKTTQFNKIICDVNKNKICIDDCMKDKIFFDNVYNYFIDNETDDIEKVIKNEILENKKKLGIFLFDQNNIERGRYSRNAPIKIEEL